MKNFVDELLITMNTPLAYEERALHHHIVALACEAESGKGPLAYDALAMILFRYQGRIPEKTLEAVGEALGLADGDREALLGEMFRRSGSLISILNRMTVGVKEMDEIYASVVLKCAESLPNRRKHPIRKMMAEVDGDVCYRLMDNQQLVKALRKCLDGVGQGVPCGIPQELRKQLGSACGTGYALSYPYLLFEADRLAKLYDDALTAERKPSKRESARGKAPAPA